MWRMTVQNCYSSLEEMKYYDEIYGIVSRCCFKTAEEMWEKNPLIVGSVYPSDFGLAEPLTFKLSGTRRRKEAIEKHEPFVVIAVRLTAKEAMNFCREEMYRKGGYDHILFKTVLFHNPSTKEWEEMCMMEALELE